MNNIFDRDFKQVNLRKSVIHSSEIIPGTIQQRHLEANLYPIKFGLAADLPETPGEDGSYFAYFATDTNTLSCWNGSAWVGTVLS